MLGKKSQILEGRPEEQLLAKYTLIICVFSLSIYIFYVCYGFQKDINNLSIINSLFMIGPLLALFFTFKGNYSLAKVLVIVSAALCISVTYHTFAIGLSILTIFLPVLLYNFYFFSFKKEKRWFIISGILSLLIIAITLLFPRFVFLRIELSPDILIQIEHVHKGVAIIITGFLFIVSVHIRSNTNRELVEKQAALERALQELTETRDQLIQTEKMASFGILTASINHEINNPLNFLVGGVENMKRIKKSGGSQKDMRTFFKIVEEGVGRIIKIVENLNHFSYQSDTSYKDCDLHFILDNCINILNPQMKRGTIIERDYCDSAIVKGNSSQLHQVFFNLITNAIQSIPEVGRIHFSTRLMPNQNVISVKIKDTGTGLITDSRNKILNPFFTKKEPGAGIGFGLSVSNRIIKEHHGQIVVNSQVNMGTEFLVTLPIST